jgi:hypothetical protein
LRVADRCPKCGRERIAGLDDYREDRCRMTGSDRCLAFASERLRNIRAGVELAKRTAQADLAFVGGRPAAFVVHWDQTDAELARMERGE